MGGKITMLRLIAVILASSFALHAEDSAPTIKQLQAQLTAKDQQIAVLNEQLAMIGQRHDNLMRALTGCLGPLPQQQAQQPALNPQQRRMMQRPPAAPAKPEEPK